MSRRAKHVFRVNVPDRWMAEIHYITGPDEITVKAVAFEEIEDLDEVIERGPDWNTIDKIIITLNRSTVTPFPSCAPGA